MLNKPKSRWANDEEDAEWEKQRKREKEEKKKAKAEKQRKSALAANLPLPAQAVADNPEIVTATEPPTKRRRLTPAPDVVPASDSSEIKVLRFPAPQWSPCRHVDNFEKLNHIEEGSYGWVSRARESATGEIVALKKLKMENPNDGFPVTGLREIQTLMAARHPHIVTLREVVIGDGLNE